MTNRQLSTLETRKKLLDTGRKIIGEKGLADTSIEEITQAAGISKGTFYTYFKRKEDIVFELSRNMFQKILENAKSFEDKEGYAAPHWHNSLELVHTVMTTQFENNVRKTIHVDEFCIVNPWCL